MGEYTYLIIIAVIGFMQAVSVAVIGGLLSRESKKRKTDEERIEKRAKMRAKESLLSMKLMSANNNLTIATARAVKDGKTNGEMTNALACAELAQKEYKDFINNIASEHMAVEV